MEIRHAIETGMDPDILADHVFHAILDKRLYILTHPELKERIKERLTNILNERNPVLHE